MTKKLDRLFDDFKEGFGLLISISFGIFLFVLFFQPFANVNFDFNNSLIFVGGFGTIVFVVMVLIRIFIPWVSSLSNQAPKNFILPSYFNGFIIVVLCTLAFEFYLRYVGGVSITFFLTIKVIIVCLAPPLILAYYDSHNELKKQNELLITEKKIIQKKVGMYEEQILDKSVEFISENNSENLTLSVSEIAIIKSSDNYVEIIYREGESFRKKLIRNTLRNVEFQLRQYSNFIRCHRICIVNLHYIDKLIRNNNNYLLAIKGYEEQIPVSRQYLLKLREAI